MTMEVLGLHFFHGLHTRTAGQEIGLQEIKNSRLLSFPLSFPSPLFFFLGKKEVVSAFTLLARMRGGKKNEQFYGKHLGPPSLSFHPGSVIRFVKRLDIFFLSLAFSPFSLYSFFELSLSLVFAFSSPYSFISSYDCTV